MTDHGSDKAATVHGVPGRLTHATTKPGGKPGLWLKQTWISESRSIDGYGKGGRIRVTMRFDDECNNGHNTFAITAEVSTDESRRRRDLQACGCLHEDIARVFPELADLIQWHLWSTDGGLHYAANAAYHASNRDCWGKLAGEPKQWATAIQFGINPILHRFQRESFVKFLQENRKGVGCDFDFEVLRMDHKNREGDNYKFGPKFTFGGYAAEWHECPFDDEDTALRFLAALQHCEPKFVQVVTSWGEGKARDLDAARRTANWPEATDEELCAPDLKEKLLARLPDLLAQFRAAIESTGCFRWESPVVESSNV